MSIDPDSGIVSTASLTQEAGSFNVCVTVTDTTLRRIAHRSALNSVITCCPFSVAGAIPIYSHSLLLTSTITAPPVLACPATAAETTVGVPFSMTVSLQGGQGTLVWTTSGLPNSATFTPETRTVTSSNMAPNMTPGMAPNYTPPNVVYHAVFQVTDGTGVASNSITCDIRVNQPPVAGCGNIYCRVGVPCWPCSPGAGWGTPPFALSVTGLPPGLAYNSTTSEIEGTVDFATSGVYVVNVTDAVGATATRSCTYVILPTPVLACPAPLMDATFPYNSAVTVSGGTPPYTFSLDGWRKAAWKATYVVDVVTGGNRVIVPLLPGVYFNVLTGAVSGTPFPEAIFQEDFFKLTKLGIKTWVETTTEEFNARDANGVWGYVNCEFNITRPPSIGCPPFPLVRPPLCAHLDCFAYHFLCLVG
jgi:hypothetical protein